MLDSEYKIPIIVIICFWFLCRRLCNEINPNLGKIPVWLDILYDICFFVPVVFFLSELYYHISWFIPATWVLMWSVVGLAVMLIDNTVLDGISLLFYLWALVITLCFCYQIRVSGEIATIIFIAFWMVGPFVNTLRFRRNRLE